jgi:hypothetical protein
MSQRIRTKLRRTAPHLLWIFGLALLVFLLIYFEQTPSLTFLNARRHRLLIIDGDCRPGSVELSSSEPTPGRRVPNRPTSQVDIFVQRAFLSSWQICAARIEYLRHSPDFSGGPNPK